MCVNEEYTIGFYALHNIAAHSEIVYDYGYEKVIHGDELVKNGLITDWMKDSSMAGQVRIQRHGGKQ